MYILATLDDNGSQSVLDETEGGKESAGSLAHDDDTLGRRNIGIMSWKIFRSRRFFVNKNPDSEIDIHGIVARVDTAFEDSQALDSARVDTLFACYIFLNGGS